MTTKIHAAVDALGLPIRFVLTPGQWGDCPQARGLIEGLVGVGHVMADAAHDADDLRHFIGCFFNRIKRFRRIALRCEKTVSSFRAFVTLACTMTWLA